jgi:hypothetical protein
VKPTQIGQFAKHVLSDADMEFMTPVPGTPFFGAFPRTAASPPTVVTGDVRSAEHPATRRAAPPRISSLLIVIFGLQLDGIIREG